ncbi:50S ribosomal protein L7/L12 [Candidatus Berkelbacteria bacterium]|nr:50S ribosomal protein L7/L12 [Candidatus Berkelbacteria bacterium]
MAEEKTSKFGELIKQIEELSVLDLAELVKELEERLGVSAAAPVAMTAAPGAVAGAETPAEEKSVFTLHLADAGTQKIAVIKAIREIRSDLGLKEAKDLVDSAPKEVKKDLSKEEAETAKKKLEEAGAKVELK